MDSGNFDTSRIDKERSLELVLKICQEVGLRTRGCISPMQNEGSHGFRIGVMKKEKQISKKPYGFANLGWALLAQGKLDECNALFLENLAGREKALGKDDKESARTGLILYVLGNVQATQQLWDASFEYHQRALRHMIATVGEKDFYTANVIHKVAEHLIRLDENDEALAMVNKALDIWCVDRNVHKIEIARTTFLKGKLFETMGKIQNR
ncbi:hypothetical protein LOZ36_004705 [Ophidiomyces ophidiicola]|nr:hypothetical protein LOZ43_004214 [Ophidiomyces ophidiicola]KAI2084564.1 hypothetical protein LOZ36_004705 [Ophidiomyces ophidiicola]